MAHSLQHTRRTRLPPFARTPTWNRRHKQRQTNFATSVWFAGRRKLRKLVKKPVYTCESFGRRRCNQPADALIVLWSLEHQTFELECFRILLRRLARLGTGNFWRSYKVAFDSCRAHTFS
jgi:hypothetical protein